MSICISRIRRAPQVHLPLAGGRVGVLACSTGDGVRVTRFDRALQRGGGGDGDAAGAGGGVGGATPWRPSVGAAAPAWWRMWEEEVVAPVRVRVHARAHAGALSALTQVLTDSFVDVHVLLHSVRGSAAPEARVRDFDVRVVGVRSARAHARGGMRGA